VAATAIAQALGAMLRSLHRAQRLARRTRVGRGGSRRTRLIVLAPGVYVLQDTLYINGTFSNVGVGGALGNADDVVLMGRG
jgi:hypothetical protein